MATHVWHDFENATALNLAAEGLEAVDVLRTLNWFKYSSDRKHCWLMLGESKPTDPCVAPNLLQSGFYVVERSLSPPWKLTFIGNDEEARLDNERYRVRFSADKASIVTPNTSAATDNGSVTTKANWPTTTVIKPENESVFFRMVEIRPDENVPPKKIIVTSKVQWQSGKDTYETSLSTVYTNYPAYK